MAIKYNTYHRDHQGQLYHIYIDVAGYAGAPMRFAISSLEIAWDEVDAHEPIMGSRCTMEVVARDKNLMQDILYSTSDGQFPIFIERKTGDDPVKWERVWAGYVSNDAHVSNVLAKQTYTFMLNATDFLGKLQYHKPFQVTDIVWADYSLFDIIDRCLTPIKPLGFECLIRAECYLTGGAWLEGEVLFDSYMMDAALMRDPSEPLNAQEILSSILKLFNLRIYHSHGKIVIVDAHMARDIPSMIRVSGGMKSRVDGPRIMYVINQKVPTSPFAADADRLLSIERSSSGLKVNLTPYGTVGIPQLAAGKGYPDNTLPNDVLSDHVQHPEKRMWYLRYNDSLLPNQYRSIILEEGKAGRSYGDYRGRGIAAGIRFDFSRWFLDGGGSFLNIGHQWVMSQRTRMYLSRDLTLNLSMKIDCELVAGVTDDSLRNAGKKLDVIVPYLIQFRQLDGGVEKAIWTTTYGVRYPDAAGNQKFNYPMPVENIRLMYDDTWKYTERDVNGDTVIYDFLDTHTQAFPFFRLSLPREKLGAQTASVSIDLSQVALNWGRPDDFPAGEYDVVVHIMPPRAMPPNEDEWFSLWRDLYHKERMDQIRWYAIGDITMDSATDLDEWFEIEAENQYIPKSQDVTLEFYPRDTLNISGCVWQKLGGTFKAMDRINLMNMSSGDPDTKFPFEAAYSIMKFSQLYHTRARVQQMKIAFPPGQQQNIYPWHTIGFQGKKWRIIEMRHHLTAPTDAQHEVVIEEVLPLRSDFSLSIEELEYMRYDFSTGKYVPK